MKIQLLGIGLIVFFFIVGLWPGVKEQQRSVVGGGEGHNVAAELVQPFWYFQCLGQVQSEAGGRIFYSGICTGRFLQP